MSETSRAPTAANIALGLGAFVVASVLPAARRRERIVRRTLPLMGTIAEIAVVESGRDAPISLIDAAMGRWPTSSAPCRASLRHLTSAGRTRRRARPCRDQRRDGVRRRRGAALGWSRAQDGAFDPAIGGAVTLWDVTHRHELPAEADVQRVGQAAVSRDRGGVARPRRRAALP